MEERSSPGEICRGGFLLRHRMVAGSKRSRTLPTVADRGCGPGGRQQHLTKTYTTSSSTPPRRQSCATPSFWRLHSSRGRGRGGASALLVPTGHGDRCGLAGQCSERRAAGVDAPARGCSRWAGGGETAALGGGKWRQAAAVWGEHDAANWIRAVSRGIGCGGGGCLRYWGDSMRAGACSFLCLG
jgi:hypothetical protein